MAHCQPLHFLQPDVRNNNVLLVCTLFRGPPLAVVPVNNLRQPGFPTSSTPLSAHSLVIIVVVGQLLVIRNHYLCCSTRHQHESVTYIYRELRASYHLDRPLRSLFLVFSSYFGYLLIYLQFNGYNGASKSSSDHPSRRSRCW